MMDGESRIWLTRIGKTFRHPSLLLPTTLSGAIESIKANTTCSLQFNVVSKGLGSERMSFYLNEAAGDIRDILMPTLEAPKAKL